MDRCCIRRAAARWQLDGYSKLLLFTRFVFDVSLIKAGAIRSRAIVTIDRYLAREYYIRRATRN